MSTTANLILKETDNQQLKKLLIECDQIGNSHAPANVRKSQLMNQLFAAEKSPYLFWVDQYYRVSRAIEMEILHRVMVDTWTQG